MNVAVRAALLCAAAAGIGLLLIQLYKMPIDSTPVIMWAVTATIAFNSLFLFLKFRYAFPVIAAMFYLYIRVEDVLFNLGCFVDYILIYIDGGMVNTAVYASRPAYMVVNEMSYSFVQGLQKSVILLCVVLALIYAVSSRGKFIGSVLITCIVVLIPAIASQKASFVPAMTVLVISMLGLYSIWASQEQSFLKNIKPRKLKKGPFIPKIHRYAVNGAMTVVIAFIACGLANVFLPVEKTHEIIQFWENAANSIVDKVTEIMDSFSIEGNLFETVPLLDHSGFMPSGNVGGSLSINSPTVSRREILRVTLEDTSTNIYLRNGIGAVFNPAKGSWDVNGNAGDFAKKFPTNFYPEHEYLAFRQKMLAFNYHPDTLIGIQKVVIEYLVRSPHVMLPTSPYLPNYKTDSRFNYNQDTVLRKRSGTSAETYYWDVLYYKNNTNFGEIAENIQNLLTAVRPLTLEEADYYDGIRVEDYDDYIYTEINREPMAIRIYANEYGLTAEKYLDYLNEYEQLVYEVYTATVESERENIKQLLTNVSNYRPLFSSYRGVFTDDFLDSEFYLLNDYYKAEAIKDYFISNYTYSLVTDNNSGPNTMLGNFLFETKQGHCALYATCMTLALREMGIPARYVTGYVTDYARTQIILERDLHAWVEVYFKGVGWIPFDPTPPIFEYNYLEAERVGENRPASSTTTPRTTPPSSSTAPRTNPPETTPRTTTTTTPTTPPQTDSEGMPVIEPLKPKSILPLQVLFTALIILLAAIPAGSVVLFVKSLNKTERKRILKYTSLQDKKTAAEAYKFILKLLRTEGLTAQPGETPVKFAARAEKMLTEQAEAKQTKQGKPVEAAQGFVYINELIGAAEKLEFSKEELTRAEYDLLSACTDRLYKQIVSDKKIIRKFIKKIVVFNFIK